MKRTLFLTLPVLVLSGLISAFALAKPETETFLFVCEDGQKLTLSLNKDDPDSATLKPDNDGEDIALVQEIAASGVKYSGPRGEVFWNKGNAAVWQKQPDQTGVNCTIPPKP